MQANKVLATEGQQRSLLLTGKRQHGLIGQGLAGLAGFVDGQDFVPQFPQLLDDRQRKFSFA